MRVLITRPEPDASRTAAKLQRLGHESVVDSLLTLELLPPKQLPGGTFAAIAATSANALRIAAVKVELTQLRALPLYAVGGRSAEAAREAGFRNVFSADGDAVAITELIARTLPPGSRVLHLAGEERAQDLGVLLAPAKIAVEVFALYRMRAAESFGAAAAAAISSGELDAVMLFSPRSAATFVAIAERQGLAGAVRRLRHLCISHATAAPLIAIGAKVEVAAEPREDAMAALLVS
jgi:uroporphyrinogen-III synthase